MEERRYREYLIGLATGAVDRQAETRQLPHSALRDDDALRTDVGVEHLFDVVQVRESAGNLRRVWGLV